MNIIVNGIRIKVQDTGGAGAVVLLIMGLGMQLIAWPPAMCKAWSTLATASFGLTIATLG